MSGIVGIFCRDVNEAPRGEVVPMLEAIAHRGPDGSRWLHRGRVELGNCMLHTTPESLQEDLPRFDPRRKLAIAADARIDNRSALVRALRLREGGSAATITDSDLILRAYERWGEDCVSHLVGDFVFAIWDESNQRLFCARDHLGVKPFYYHISDRHFLFGSEIKSVVAHDAVDERLFEQRLLDYLVNIKDQESTLYKEVYRLRPGHTITVTPDRAARRRYWKLEPPPQGETSSDADAVQRFRSLFEEAVRCRLRSAFPISSQLSGGLDSSFVTAVAHRFLRERGGGPLHTVSLVFGAVTACDETDYVRAVLDAGAGYAPSFVDADGVGPLTRLEDIYSVVDDGLVGGTHYLIWEMIREARAQGARVMLDGIDGDAAVMHGLERFTELAASGNWSAFAREATLTAARHARADHKQRFQRMLSDATAILRRYGYPVLDDYAANRQYVRFAKAALQIGRHFGISPYRLGRRFWRSLMPFARMRSGSADRRQGPTLDDYMVHPAHAGRIEARLRAQQEQAAPGASRTVRGAQAALLGSDSLAHALEVMDHYGAALGVELRHPFLDVRLLEFCVTLPAESSLCDGWTRSIMRHAMQGYVPDKVRLRVGKADLTQSWKPTLECWKPFLRTCRRYGRMWTKSRSGNILPRGTSSAMGSCFGCRLLQPWSL